MTGLQPWLPPDRSGQIERALRTLTEAWQADWFVHPGGNTAGAAPRPGAGSDIWYGCADAAVGFDREGGVALGHAVTGRVSDPNNGRDRDLVGAVGRSAIADLALRLCKATGSDSGCGEIAADNLATGTSVHAITGAVPHQRTLEVSLSESAAVRLRKYHAGARRSPALGRLSVALSPERVRFGCHLGHASLSARDISRLDPGDVIVLDRVFGDALSLTVECIRTSAGQADIQFEAGELTMKIVEPPVMTAQAG